MHESFRRVLILDSDPDTLITLQCSLENAQIDATTTWDETEACQLLDTLRYDLLLIGDHPPEVDAGAVIDHLSLRGTCPSVLILCGLTTDAGRIQSYHRLGVSGIVPRRDSPAVVEHVKQALECVSLRRRNFEFGPDEPTFLHAAS